MSEVQLLEPFRTTFVSSKGISAHKKTWKNVKKDSNYLKNILKKITPLCDPIINVLADWTLKHHRHASVRCFIVSITYV